MPSYLVGLEVVFGLSVHLIPYYIGEANLPRPPDKRVLSKINFLISQQKHML